MRLTCIVHGKVHGVFYRSFTKEIAQSLGLTGFVHNLPGDAVEVVAEGEEARLSEFLQKLKTSYPYARVDRVDEIWSHAAGGYDNFRILRS